ncbi:BBSome-interacting protein 1 [Strigops habroptila]|uniref:BBSome-interacting protein 1 n=1 Tax=Strigops habroptila TaxID=2489341 RepID=UPI0011CFC0A7|nr:BBSome-interacting protein 1 [Strigops habroptila]
MRRGAAMPEGKAAFQEVLPKQGQLSVEDTASLVLCKPKVLPLKSVSLEKLEALQRAALAAAAPRPPEEGAQPPEETPQPQPQA